MSNYYETLSQETLNILKSLAEMIVEKFPDGVIKEMQDQYVKRVLVAAIAQAVTGEQANVILIPEFTEDGLLDGVRINEESPAHLALKDFTPELLWQKAFPMVQKIIEKQHEPDALQQLVSSIAEKVRAKRNEKTDT